MSKGKGKVANVPLEFTEAEKKALEKLEHSHLLREIQIHQERTEELQVKIYEQSEQIRQINEDNLRLTLKMEGDILVKQDELMALSRQFEAFRKQKSEEMDRMRDEKDSRIKSLNDDKGQMLYDFERKTESLEQQINKLQTFEEREVKYLATIEELTIRMKEKEYAHHDEILKNQKNFQKQTQNLTNVNNAKIEEIQRNADKLAEQKVLNKQESIKKENHKIRSEMEVYLKELEQLRKEKVTLMQDNQMLRQNVTINEDGVQEYQIKYHDQVVKIKKLKEKVGYLKQYISNEVSKYTKEIECMKHLSNQKIQELEIQIRNLKEQLYQKSKELKTVKSLAQMILDQRSDIEQFFLQAIDQVKNEIRKKNIQNKNKLPDIQQNKSHSLESIKVDINDLDLEEKEKLLRILFSKMNQGIPPANWKSHLGQSKSMADGSSFRDNNFQ